MPEQTARETARRVLVNSYYRRAHARWMGNCEECPDRSENAAIVCAFCGICGGCMWHCSCG